MLNETQTFSCFICLLKRFLKRRDNISLFLPTHFLCRLSMMAPHSVSACNNIRQLEAAGNVVEFVIFETYSESMREARHINHEAGNIMNVCFS